MVAKHSRKPSSHLRIAKNRIKTLFFNADEIFPESPELSDRYVSLARKISMKYKIKLESEFKRKFCKHCYKYLRPSVNCRVRTISKKLVYSCFNCKKFSRFQIKKSD
ncbi:ribonuclease P [Candidatus Woesearchaeota archaeon]|jgi:ribonuclease P protein subunit RPR2|nr:ribonuclease P [Candidatus Woesearchaeota archaeon]|tara:strand:+ start:1890 stop:2210 length:321 start_codon:yes stop_codon:yes gene_type:complete